MADKTVTYRLLADIGQFRAQMAQAAASTKAAADTMTGATKQGVALRAGLGQLGSTAGKVGLIAAAGLGAAVVSAANFDEAMAHVAAATHESAGNMGLLRDAALEAGARTVFSATEAANAIEELSKAGVSTADILSGGLDASLDLASAGTLDVAQAAEIAATTMNQFHLAGSDASRAADVLSAAAGKAQGEVTDIAEAMKYVGPVADQMGVSLEETAGSIAFLATQGIQGEQAGTGLRGMLLSLTSPSKQAKDELDNLGISLYDAQGNFVGLDGVAGQLHRTMGDLTNAERDEALGRIFGNAQVTTARILYAGGAEAVHKWTNAVDDSGYAAQTAATKMDSLKGDLEKLGGALQTALIDAGSGSQGPLRSLVQNITKGVDAFTELPPVAQSATTSLLGITAVFGGGLWFTSKVVQGIGDTRAALREMGVEAATTSRLMAGVGKGIEFTALIVGASALDDALDSLAHNSLEIDQLNRSLEALSQGSIAGTLSDTYGSDLQGFATDLHIVNSTLAQISGGIMKILPGDADIDDARKNIEQLDAALAGMVESGNTKGAKAAFDQLVSAAVKGGRSVDEVSAAFTQYEIALDNAGHKSTWLGDTLGSLLPDFKATGNAAKGSADGISGIGDAAGGAASKVQIFKGALEELNGLLDKRSAFRNYQASLDDFRTSFKAAAGFNLDIDPGRQNQEKLDAIAASAGVFASHLHGVARTEFVNSAIGQLRALADTMHLPQAQVDVLIARLRALGQQKPSPTVYVGGIAQSMADLAALQARIDSLHGKTVTNTVRTLGGPAAGPMADGGTVGGATRHPYGDKVLRFLAPGEEVISNRYGQADRNRALLKAINAGRMADGGTVRVQAATSSRFEFAPATVDIRMPNGDVQTVELIARRAARSEMSRENRYQDGLDDRD